jgi:hypothetical protein
MVLCSRLFLVDVYVFGCMRNLTKGQESCRSARDQSIWIKSQPCVYYLQTETASPHVIIVSIQMPYFKQHKIPHMQ